MMSALSCFVIILYLSCVTFFSLPTNVGGLGSSSTIAISYGSSSVCGILAGKSFQGIQCFRGGKTFSILPNISYEAISGGKDFFCGLSSGGFSLFCWDMRFSNTRFQAKRIYHNITSPLTDLAVGNDQVCALQAKTGILRCWKRERSPIRSLFSLPEGEIGFDTITSGEGFSCGIAKDDRNVLCWGESGMGDFIESEFGNMSMLSLVAGKSHVCGIAMSGLIICKGNNDSGQLDIPSNTPFHYSGLALGGNYTCALQRNNGSVVCWGGQISDFLGQKIHSLPFESIVAGMDFACGLASDTLTISCWGWGWPRKFNFSLPLRMMIPGPCVRDTCRICGVLPDSASLCSDNTNICRSCVVDLPLDLQSAGFHKRTSEVTQLITPPTEAPSSLSVSSPPLEKEKYRPFWAYEIFGTVGIISGLFAFGYFLYLRSSHSSNGKVQSIVKAKEINSVGSNNVDTAVVASLSSSAPQSRSSSITQISSLTLGREKSWDNLSKHVEKAEPFTLYELAVATKNFSVESKIGKGSFGTVYRGKFPDGREVAIKREEISTKKERENAFESELTLLSRVHHKHLVGLVGFCEENNERLLVYEYMTNGALYDHLHSRNNAQNSSSLLNSWKVRIKIALDAARGIEYLHNYAVPPIIHRDIKSSNILLDSKWVARVSDFGLSLKGPEGDEGGMSIKAVGTVGYIDPEYYVLKVLTTKSDVYGFGVVLLELLTGKRAVFKDVEGNGPTGVVEYTGPFIMAGEVWKVLDKRVKQPIMNESEAVEILAYTAMMCVNLEGKERPTMSDVISNLEKALALCKGSSGTFSPIYSFN